MLPACAVALLASGCVHAPLNQPLTRYDPKGGFRYTPRAATATESDISVLLFFSGGGKRAATLSYGVLRELAATSVPANDGGTRRLLDEVEIVSTVSGGSFTGAYYALHHDGIFVDFERRFLKRNVNRALLRRVATPTHWGNLASPYYGRSDLAADYYDRTVFDGATFGDLVRKGGRPLLLINATDMANGEQFTFSQIRFDLLGSDLGEFPLSRAVAASSAAPLLLTPITLQNHAGAAGEVQSAFLPDGPADPALSPREREVRELMLSYTDAKERPFIHLVDGGLSDNLGLRSIMDASLLSGGLGELSERIGMPPANKILVIIVNAATRRGSEWSKREAVPGLRHSIEQLGDNIGERVNHRSLELFRQMLDDWRRKARERAAATPRYAAGWHPPLPDYYLVTVVFEDIPHRQERYFFQNLPTSFHLPDETVDRLTDVGGRLLRESSEFQRLLGDIGATAR
jgi:NTE family protein